MATPLRGLIFWRMALFGLPDWIDLLKPVDHQAGATERNQQGAKFRVEKRGGYQSCTHCSPMNKRIINRFITVVFFW